MVMVIAVNQYTHTNIRRVPQTFWNTDDLISATMPVMIFHSPTIHQFDTIPRINVIIHTYFVVIESHHKRHRFKHRPWFHQVADSLISHFTILSVTASSHVNNGFHITGLDFHQNNRTYFAIFLFELINNCLFTEVLHFNVNGSD